MQRQVRRACCALAAAALCRSTHRRAAAALWLTWRFAEAHAPVLLCPQADEARALWKRTRPCCFALADVTWRPVEAHAPRTGPVVGLWLPWPLCRSRSAHRRALAPWLSAPGRCCGGATAIAITTAPQLRLLGPPRGAALQTAATSAKRPPRTMTPANARPSAINSHQQRGRGGADPL